MGTVRKGTHEERFETNDLSTGTYIISVESNSVNKVSKFVVMH